MFSLSSLSATTWLSILNLIFIRKWFVTVALLELVMCLGKSVALEGWGCSVDSLNIKNKGRVQEEGEELLCSLSVLISFLVCLSNNICSLSMSMVLAFGCISQYQSWLTAILFKEITWHKFQQPFILINSSKTPFPPPLPSHQFLGWLYVLYVTMYIQPR